MGAILSRGEGAREPSDVVFHCLVGLSLASLSAMRRKKLVLWTCVILAILILGPLGIVLFLFQDEPPSPDDDLRPVRREVPDEANGFFALDLKEGDVFWPEDDEKIASANDSFDAAEARSMIERNSKVFEKVAQSLAALEFQVPAMTSYNDTLPYLLAWRLLAFSLACRQRLLLEEGKLDEAMGVSLSLIQLGHRIQQAQGVVIHFLIGMAFKSMGIERAIQVIEKDPLAAGRLIRLAKELERLPAADEALRDALRQEYVCFASTIELMAQGKLSVDLLEIHPAGPELFLKIPFFLQPNTTKRLAGEFFRSLLSSISKPMAETVPWDFTRRYGAEGVGMWLRPNSVGRRGLLILLPSIQSTPNQLRIEGFQMSALRALVALKRFRIARERLPASLADLVPDYLPDVPVDPFDGKPLRYSAEKRLIYSVGEDLKDSGGSEAEEFWEALSDKKEPTLRIRA